MTDARVPTTGLEELLTHGDWLRGIVRGLVGDEHAADDVLQQTWLKALQRPPADRSNPRGWLGTVARHFALRQRLQDARRRRHERCAAAHEALRSTDEIAADLQLRGRLVQALKELDEPFRSTLWWRYVERRTAVEIARAQGVSASAVRSRVQRGLAKLRARLVSTEPDARRGGALAFASLLLNGGMLVGMGTGTKSAATLAVVGLAAAIWWVSSAPVDAPAAAEAAFAAPGAMVAGAEPRRGEATTSPDRSVVERDVPSPATDQPRSVLRGQVLDERGLPLAGIAVGWSRGSPPTGTVVSADGGRFELRLPPDDKSGDGAEKLAVIAVDEAWITLRAWPHLDASRHATIVVVPAVALAGRVVDAHGQPLAEVTVAVEARELSLFPESLEQHLAYSGVSARTDSDGGFSFPAVPAARDARIGVSHLGYHPHDAPVPQAGDLSMQVVLRRAWPDRLRGVVVDQNGAAVEGAEVVWGRARTHSDSAGHFECDWPTRRESQLRMVAVAPGHQPFVRDYSRAIWEEEGRPERLRVALGGEPLAISGTVRHADGRAATGFFVALRDGAMIYGRQPDATAEQLAAGLGDVKPIEAFPLHADGRFEVRGLRPQSYRLTAWDPRTLLAISTEPIEAGRRGVDIVIPSDAMRESLRGRVLSRSGQPLAGVTVSPVLQLLPGMGGQARVERSVVTDAEGRFALADVPRRGQCWIGLTGDPVIGIFHEVESFADQEEVELRADARCRIRFLEGAGSVRADALVVHDAEDRLVPMWIMTEGDMVPKNWLPLEGKPSGEFAISERARWLVYLRDGEEVERREIVLVPGQLNQIAL